MSASHIVDSSYNDIINVDNFDEEELFGSDIDEEISEDLSDSQEDNQTGLENASEKSSNHSKSFVCPICFDEPDTIAVTPCGHMYCSNCIFKALSSKSYATSTKGECSICRKPVTYKSVTFLEFKI